MVAAPTSAFDACGKGRGRRLGDQQCTAAPERPLCNSYRQHFDRHTARGLRGWRRVPVFRTECKQLAEQVRLSGSTGEPLRKPGNRYLVGPGLQSYDMSLAKHFPIKERFNLRLQAEFFNAFNVANFSGLGVTITNTSFGTLSSAYPPRQIQLALKLAF